MKSHVQDKHLESSSGESGSEDDEEAWKLTGEVEKEFFKTLSHIKSKDPKIYQKDVEFFKDVPIPEEKPKKEKPKTPALTLRDYERKIVIEKGGELSDEELPAKSMMQPSYVEEQRALKNSLKSLLQSDSEYESEAEWGGLFKKRQKSKTEEEKEEDAYKDWLKGQKSEAPDEEVAKEMKPLRDFWTNPDLNQGDQFLRDYILNKRFLDDDKGDSGVDLDKLQDESETEENEDQLGKSYSHRFEEPDQEFIKRYPRVMENSVRRKDDSRRRKREEIKERKQKEKEKKKVEVKQKQKLKKKEIEQKLDELKQLTGNEKLAFENVLDKDFDIDEHDKAMQRLFNEEFYSKDDPNFKPNDHIDCEDDGNDDVEEDVKEDGDEYVDNDDEPQCEDPDFNMDCDYDPSTASSDQKASRSRRRKDKHRRTTISEAVKREKPVFDPATHKSYQEYMDQYFAIDCEDFIGDLPCRFKYRRTIPNSYGLTVEEILAADPKELERWCSIKRVTQLKPSYKEKGDAMCYKRRAADEKLKRKILPSLYKKPDEERSVEDVVSEHDSKKKTDNVNVENNVTTKKKKKSEASNHNDQGKTDLSKKRKLVASESIVAPNKRRKIAPEQRKSPKSHKNHENIKNNKKKVNKKDSNENSTLLDMSDARLQAYGIKPKKFRNKLKYNSTDSNKSKSVNKSKGNNQKIKRKGNLSGSRKKGRKSPEISKKKNNVKSKLAKKSSNGWVISNAS